jgi:hypothetical protein
LSVKLTPRTSLRPSAFGEKSAGSATTRPSVRLTVSGTVFTTSAPTAARAVSTTLYTPSGSAAPSIVTVWSPARVHTRSTGVATVTPPGSTIATVTFAAAVSR